MYEYINYSLYPSKLCRVLHSTQPQQQNKKILKNTGYIEAIELGINQELKGTVSSEFKNYLRVFEAKCVFSV